MRVPEVIPQAPGCAAGAGALPVPPFYCPVPSNCAPDSANVDRQTVDWMDRLGVYGGSEQREYLARMNVGLFASLTIPEGATERRQVYSDLFMLVFALDDSQFDEPANGQQHDTERLLLRLDRTLQAPLAALPSAASWPIVALGDIWSRLNQIATPAQLGNWVSALRAYLLNATLTTRYRRRHQPPTLDDYTVIRLGDGAMLLWEAMIPIVGDYELAGHEVADPRVRALEDMANLLPMWDNDIFGYPKEAFRSARYGYPAVSNLVMLLAREHRCTVEHALGLAMGMRDRVMCLFLRLRAQVLGEASPALTRYLTGLGQWVRGYLDWAFTTTRYTDPRNPSDPQAVDLIAMPTSWAEHPTDGNSAPLALPTIAWWWEQLQPPARPPARLVSRTASEG